MSDALSRRGVLRVVAGGAVAAPVMASAAQHPAVFPLTHDADLELLELRRAIDAYQAAVRYEMSIEDCPGYKAAVAKSEKRQAYVQALVSAIHERPVTGLRDVALRAEALRQWFFKGPYEPVSEWADRDPHGQEYCYAKLYEAAVIVGVSNANDA
jgi:hypothetical protein